MEEIVNFPKMWNERSSLPLIQDVGGGEREEGEGTLFLYVDIKLQITQISYP